MSIIFLLIFISCVLKGFYHFLKITHSWYSPSVLFECKKLQEKIFDLYFTVLNTFSTPCFETKFFHQYLNFLKFIYLIHFGILALRHRWTYILNFMFEKTIWGWEMMLWLLKYVKRVLFNKISNHKMNPQPDNNFFS